MSIEDNKATVRRLHEEVWNNGNVAAIDDLIDPNMVVHYHYPAHVPVPAHYHLSREEFKQSVSHLHITFPDFHFTIELQVAKGDLVATRGTAQGTHRGVSGPDV